MKVTSAELKRIIKEEFVKEATPDYSARCYEILEQVDEWAYANKIPKKALQKLAAITHEGDIYFYNVEDDPYGEGEG